MRARYTDLEGIDSVESEENILVSRTSTLAGAEYAAQTTDEGPTKLGLSDTNSLAGGFYEVEGELQGIGSTFATLNDYTYSGPLVADPYPENETLFGTDGNDVIDGGNGHDKIQGYLGDDLLMGGAGNDFISGDEGNDRVEGGDGDDFIMGGVGDDVVFGGAGRDQIYGGNGIDHLYGGEGNDYVDGGGDVDYVDGGAGDDILMGGAGNDMVWGGDGNDRLDGGDGYDLLYGGAGNDTLFGRSHGDSLFGGAGDDVIYGDGWFKGDTFETSAIEGADTLYGEDGNDRLFGVGGDDQLFGGEGHDILNGGNGNDVINGGTGADRLIGGAGRDTFVLADRPYQGYHYSELDVIADFQFYTDNTSFSGDWIDLRQIFDKHTSFAGTTANEAWAQGYLYLVQHGNPGDADFGTKVYIDPNGHAPDTPSYYGHSHDFAVVDLLGVARNEFDAFNQEAAFLSKYFLV